MLWVLLEAPRRGASNEYPQHMFSWRNKKNINTFGLKKKKSALTSAMNELCQSRSALFAKVPVLVYGDERVITMA